MSHPSAAGSTRSRLHDAALRVVSAQGPSASVRTITRAAGVTEGTLYRHYESREQLLSAVYAELVAPMIVEKENLVAMRAGMKERLREWIRCTYARFDRDPDGFAYVFLTEHALSSETVPLQSRQSELFGEMLRQGRAAGEMRDVHPQVAQALFIGLLLSVPTRVRAGGLKPPALKYVDDVSEAVWLALGEAGPRGA